MNQHFYLVAGLGKTGRSIAGYLRRRNLPFALFDTRSEVEGLADVTRDFPDVELFLHDLPATLCSRLTGVIASPGVAIDTPVFQDIVRSQIPVVGDIECLAREITAPVIAITGTNGKSTVTTLVGEMAQAAGFSVAVAGNIGTPVLDLLDDGRHYDLWVLELSSFQLDLIHSLQPVAATILNISPDHLDRHHDYAAYCAAKQRIYDKAGAIIHNRDDRQTYACDASVDSLCVSFGLDRPSADDWGILRKDGDTFLACGDDGFLNVDHMRLKGTHNWQNALAACALARMVGIEKKHMVSVLQTFSGLPHRCQWVRRLDAVDWINDSKGTNVGATISAITGIGGSRDGKIVLIAGGIGKGADFSQLKAAIEEHVRSVVLIGVDAAMIEAAISGRVPIVHAQTFHDAIVLAKQQAIPGDAVLLSPACASFDMFRDFNHRGESFTELAGLL